MKSWMNFFPANPSHEKKKSFSDCLLCMSIFAQNAIVILGNSDPSRLNFLTFQTANKCTNQSQQLCRMSVTSLSYTMATMLDKTH